MAENVLVKGCPSSVPHASFHHTTQCQDNSYSYNLVSIKGPQLLCLIHTQWIIYNAFSLKLVCGIGEQRTQKCNYLTRKAFERVIGKIRRKIRQCSGTVIPTIHSGKGTLFITEG